MSILTLVLSLVLELQPSQTVLTVDVFLQSKGSEMNQYLFDTRMFCSSHTVLQNVAVNAARM